LTGFPALVCALVLLSLLCREAVRAERSEIRRARERNRAGSLR